MSETNARQQIVEKVKESTNILVTVSDNPSVDELSAALGLTLLLNKMKKHATAVFSGEIPPAITFLDPEKTFENTVDSLRDFIIALDKEKADHLRYKVEGDVVKIFVTPYRTTITSDDLEFSQGDYNVELVLALGVRNQGSIDKALAAHGQIFDDAVVATIIAGGEKSELGSISWYDGRASSLSEMIVNLSDALKIDKGFIDEQIATALLAGIVAATERFSNSLTSARVMTIAAQLMGSGANQQLIASKFEEANEEGDHSQDQQSPPPDPESPVDASTPDDTPPPPDEPVRNSDGTTTLSEGESTKLEKDVPPPQSETLPEKPADDGTLHISHELEGTLEEVAQKTAIESQEEAARAAEEELARQTAAAAADVTPAEPVIAQQESSDQLPPVAPVQPDVSPADLQRDVAAANAEVEAAAEAPRLQGAVSPEAWKDANKPIYGGILNATTEAAAEEARKLEENDRNKTILHHSGGYIAEQIPTYDSPINAAFQQQEEPAIVNPLDEPAPSVSTQAPPVQPLPPSQDMAEQAVAAPDLPPMPDFSTLPPLPPMPSLDQPGEVQPPEKLGDILPPAPAADQQPAPSDPAQFRIPGQN